MQVQSNWPDKYGEYTGRAFSNIQEAYLGHQCAGVAVLPEHHGMS